MTHGALCKPVSLETPRAARGYADVHGKQPTGVDHGFVSQTNTNHGFEQSSTITWQIEKSEARKSSSGSIVILHPKLDLVLTKIR